MKRPKAKPAVSTKPPRRLPEFLAEFRAIVRPERKWHYVFHGAVVAIALAYWIGSLFVHPDASWREIVMYRPSGDNQVYPVITALSRLNFGDPTDAFNYGKGVAGFHAVILLPHAMAVAVFGWPGYMVVDALFFWLYFVAITWVLRRAGLRTVSSLALGSVLATGALRELVRPVGVAIGKWIEQQGIGFSEWKFPDLFALTVYDPRIPRPFITEILVVLVIGILIRACSSRGTLDLRAGIGAGALMSLMAQGDPYSFSTLGLVVLAVVIWQWAGLSRTAPWKFLTGFVGSGVVVGAYFIFQMLGQNEEAAVRFGLTHFARDKWMNLPGYGPMFRFGVIAILSALLLVISRVAFLRSTTEKDQTEGAAAGNPPNAMQCAQSSREIAWFGLCLVAAAYFAQPVQLFLLGRGAQIYHYLLFTLPCFYSYALILIAARLGVHLAALVRRMSAARFVLTPSPWVAVPLLLALFGGEAVLGTRAAREAINTTRTARNENTQWARDMHDYRAGFRALDAALVRDPILREARTFAAFNHEINFLLAGFHNKRAYLPDNGFTTLPDKELERRLFEVAKIFRLGPNEQFASLIQNSIVLNYWLGCAKYWFSSEHTFASRTNYIPEQLAHLDTAGEQLPFNLSLPVSEIERLNRDYQTVMYRDSDVSTYPDIIVVSTLVKGFNIEPAPGLYSAVYTNAAFWVYRKVKYEGLYSAGPPQPAPQ